MGAHRLRLGGWISRGDLSLEFSPSEVEFLREFRLNDRLIVPKWTHRANLNSVSRRYGDVYTIANFAWILPRGNLSFPPPPPRRKRIKRMRFPQKPRENVHASAFHRVGEKWPEYVKLSFPCDSTQFYTHSYMEILKRSTLWYSYRDSCVDKRALTGKAPVFNKKRLYIYLSFFSYVNKKIL